VEAEMIAGFTYTLHQLTPSTTLLLQNTKRWWLDSRMMCPGLVPRFVVMVVPLWPTGCYISALEPPNGQSIGSQAGTTINTIFYKERNLI
jgi:hypothetical protein